MLLHHQSSYNKKHPISESKIISSTQIHDHYMYMYMNGFCICLHLDTGQQPVYILYTSN